MVLNAFRHQSIQKLLRLLMWFAIACIILMGILAGLTRSLSPLIEKHQSQLTLKISQQLHMPVKIGSIKLSWSFLSPEIIINDVVIVKANNPEQPLLTVQQVDLELRLFHSIWVRSPIIKNITIYHVFIDPTIYQSLTTSSVSPKKHRLPWDKMTLNIEHLTVPGEGKIPGIGDIDLRLQLQGKQGEFVASIDNSQIQMPWLFRLPIQLQSSKAKGVFKYTKRGLNLSLSELSLNVPEGHVQAMLDLNIPKTGNTYINLDAKADLNQLTKHSVYNYLPIAILSKPLLHWLDTAILKVDAAQSHFVLRGYLVNFPFLHQDGEFLVDSQLTNASLAYDPNWPIIKGINAHMVFEGRSMDITTTAANIGNLPISQARVSIPVMDVVQPVILNVSANAQGDTETVIQLLDHLPLQSINQLSKYVQGQGPLALALNLRLPLANAPEEQPDVSGTADLQTVSLALTNFPELPLTNLTGQVTFNQTGLSAEHLTGQWLKMPIQLRLQQGGNNSNKVFASLKANMQQLQGFLPVNLRPYFAGQTTVNLALNANIHQILDVTLSTDLQGLAIKLPVPLNKPAMTKQAMDVLLKPGSQTGAWQLDAEYGKTLSLSAQIQAAKLQSLSIVWGAKVSSVNQAIQISVSQNQWNMNPWIDFLSKTAIGAGPFSSALPLQLNINVKQLQVRQYQLNNVKAQSSYQNNKVNLNLASNQINGQINYQLPTANQKAQLQINLKRLILPSGNVNSVQSKIAWQSFPATQFTCQSVQIGKLNLSQVNTTFTPSSGGLTISNLSMQTKAASLKSSGSWQWQPARTQLNGSINTANLAQFLRDMGLSGNMAAKQGSVQFKLNWPGAPWEMSLGSVSGSASLAIGPGRITGLSKSTDASMGLGKLITLLSLQGLMQIGDLTQEGFAFSKITGQFQFMQGNLQVTQAEVKGTVADLTFKGQIGLLQQTYNLRMGVVAQLTSSLPVVATIAGGPVVGAVTWVVNKAVGSQVDKIGGSQYLVTGTWQKPVINKVGFSQKPL